MRSVFGGLGDSGPSGLPVRTGFPSIVADGYLGEGTVFTATPGTWEDADTVAGQWQMAGPPPSAFAYIDGETGLTLTLGSELEEGARYRYRETATNGLGSASSNSNVITLVVPSNLTLPVVTGDTGFGDELETSDGTWTGKGNTYAYQWLRDGQDIGGATGDTYEIQLADNGALISCRVTATNAIGSGSAIAAGVQVPLSSVPINADPPSISGTQEPGESFTCLPGVWDHDPTSYAYQWFLDGAGISGETSDTYVLLSADDGLALSCRVTAANMIGDSEAAFSDPVTLEYTPVELSAPVIGFDELGVAYQITAATFDHADSVTLQWLRNDSPESGETSATYGGPLANGDTLVLRATGHNGSKTADSDSNGITYEDEGPPPEGFTYLRPASGTYLRPGGSGIYLQP